jgi:hypothetical protein
MYTAAFLGTRLNRIWRGKSWRGIELNISNGLLSTRKSWRKALKILKKKVC